MPVNSFLHEIDQLNRIVTIYLEFAELQAMNHKPMTMQDWIKKLDQFLQISEREILTHAGSITAEAARLKAENEYEKYQRLLDTQPSPVEQHFDEAVKKAKRLEQPKKSCEELRGEKMNIPHDLGKNSFDGMIQ